MRANPLYTVLAGVYDLLDVIYFRNWEKSPRKAVLDAISPQDEILDLCTGTASTAIAIAKAMPQAKIVGVDLSAKMLQVARRKVEKAGIRNVELHEMDATRLRFEDGHFDVILISLVLHEMDEDLRAKLLKEARRVLKKDGKIIVTEWERSPQASKRALFLPIHLLEPKPYRAFLHEDLYPYFEKHGLKIERYTHHDYTKVITLKHLDA